VYGVKPGRITLPARSRLSREKIAAAALRIADAKGLEAVSMRNVAEALGVGTMSLYNHVRDKADLETLLLDVVSRPEKPSAKKGDWEARAKTAIRRIVAALNRHPSLVPLLLKRTTTSEAALQPIEELLSSLHDGGFKGKALLRAYHTLLSFLTGSILTDLTGTFSVGNARSAPDLAKSVMALDPARFPHLQACAKIAAQSKPGEEFEYGLSAVLAGLKAANDTKVSLVRRKPRPQLPTN
jgi:AcrR family transcriptional regulator